MYDARFSINYFLYLRPETNEISCGVIELEWGEFLCVFY